MVLKTELFLAWVQQCQFFFIIVKFLTTLYYHYLKLSYFKIDSGGYLAQLRNVDLHLTQLEIIWQCFDKTCLEVFPNKSVLILIGSQQCTAVPTANQNFVWKCGELSALF